MPTHPPRKGSLFGGILLIAGCCIGAGMLGLPVLSAMAGFIPSAMTFAICWFFMAVTGLLLLEVNLWFGEEISIVTMAERTLGPVGKLVSWFVYLFLFYSLMVAYVAASGSLAIDFINHFTGTQWPNWIGHLLFCLLFAILIYLGTGVVDWFNRLLMLGLIAAYACLVIIGAKHVNPALLQHRDWGAATLVVPAVIISFGFHNLIPSLTTYLNSHVKSLKRAIFIGSSIPLVVYLLWEWLILGLVPMQDFQGALDQGEMATQALKTAVGASWILDVAEVFAFFAIVTSFLSVALSFVDFLADGLNMQKTAQGTIFLEVLVLGPPFIFALLYPSIFLIALNYAGGFGAVILFGILPALMVWQGRYNQKFDFPHLMPGGRPVLLIVIGFAIGVIILTYLTL